MKGTQAGTTTEIPAPTATVKVSDEDELGVWAVGEGTPVVLVHGSLFWYLLKPLAEELAKKGDYQAIWYHRRGYNGKPTEPPVAVADQARDVVKILDELKISKAHVVGHSAGGTYTVELAMQAQDRLLSAVLLDWFFLNQIESGNIIREQMRPSIEKAQTGDFEGAAVDLLATLECTEELMDRTLPGSWSDMLEDAPTWFQVEAPAGPEWTPDRARVKAIEVPVALISVTELPPYRETAELLKKWLPNLTMLEISSDHHFFPVTATEETAAVIDNWITSQGTTN